MDYELLSRELVRALRGARSQGAANRRLRRTSNALHTWERGTRTPSTTDFLRLAALARVDVNAVGREFGAPSPLALARDASGIAEWVRTLARSVGQAELARRIGRNRNTVARWLEGKTEPRLPDLLRLVAATTLRLLDFVVSFAPAEQLPSIEEAYRDLRLQRTLAYEMPWTHAILRTLELRAYAALPHHDTGRVARSIGIEEQEVERCLSELSRAGQIRFRRGKWHVQRILPVDTRDEAKKNLILKRHWANVALQRLDGGATEAGALFSYNLFAISEDGLEQIRKAHLDYYSKLRSIVAACDDPTRLVLANVQLLPLDLGARPER